jgi:flagellar basal body-associated protein FliL
MSKDFNPYSEWFKIPLDQQPPHHYQLLGLELFESDLDRIDQASEQRLIFLQDVANGPHTKHSQKLLNEVASARLCLLDKDKKADYDYGLQHPESLKQNKVAHQRANSVASNSSDKEILDDIFQSTSKKRPARKEKTVEAKTRPEQGPVIQTNKPRPMVQISTAANTTAPVDQEANKNKQLIIVGLLAVSVMVPLAIIGIGWLTLGQRSDQADERDVQQQAIENTTAVEDLQPSSGNPFRKSGLVSSTIDSDDNTATAKTKDAVEKTQKQVAPTKNEKNELNQKQPASQKSTSQKSGKGSPGSSLIAAAKGVPTEGLEIWLSALEKNSLKLEIVESRVGPI